MTTHLSDKALSNLPAFYLDFTELAREMNLDCEQANIFLLDLSQRLDKGRQTYGDSSFNRQFADIAGEIIQEQVDTAGWAWIAWTMCADDDVRRELLEIAVEGFRLWVRLKKVVCDR